MTTTEIFDKLWKDYSILNPSVEKIHKLFTEEGNTIINDHIALRTFDDPRISIDVLAKVFIENGYILAGSYNFPAKKLFAKHFEIQGDAKAPRVFISQLILNEFSPFLQTTIRNSIERISIETLNSSELIFNGQALGTPDFEIYEKLRNESEYAAWVYAFSFRANHFTVSINHLNSVKGNEKVNELLKSHGFSLNNSGGEIKGSEAEFLKQSSTLADRIPHSFIQGSFQIPSCYYEFAERFKDEKGNYFSGFIAESADKIFESTDFRK
ncbi:MAG: DUF1338 domain-containing protein [Bacteroidales bacterium]|nr:DUF1338 domain-containing protein [Bacteroidales bacterium]MCF8391736.1 DUF1338 domain-containing protein [Bacteroidales bacterium]